jgi:hypothetical protein
VGLWSATGITTIEAVLTMKSNHAGRMQEFMSADQVRRFLTVQMAVSLELKTTYRAFGKKVPDGMMLLQFEAPELIKDTIRLEYMHKLVIATLDQLLVMGCIDDNGPAFNL